MSESRYDAPNQQVVRPDGPHRGKRATAATEGGGDPQAARAAGGELDAMTKAELLEDAQKPGRRPPINDDQGRDQGGDRRARGR